MDIKSFQKINNKNILPNSPGVYFFLKEKEIIYIGKATSLKDRVKSYFGKDLIETRGPIILDMVFKADKIKHQKTDSVLEALILEAELIKKHQPKYNTKEKSDKSFNYVVLTKEKLPKVIIVREKELNKKLGYVSAFYGPFTSGSQLREALKIIRKIFPFLDDKSKNYLEFYKQINLVPDIVGKRSFLKEEQSDGEGETLRRQYIQNIRNIKLFFEGKKTKILKNLQKEMVFYAKNREFEKAGEIKRQLFALQHINDIALLKNLPYARRHSHSVMEEQDSSGHSEDSFEHMADSFRIEAYDIAHMGGKNMVGVMTVVIDGEVEKSEYKKFKIRTQNNANDTGALAEVLERRFLHPEWKFPDIIVVDGGVAQLNVAKKITSRFHLDVSVVAVVKNERHKPKAILSDEEIIKKYKQQILLANSEAHRFAINYHKKMRNKNFLN